MNLDFLNFVPTIFNIATSTNLIQTFLIKFLLPFSAGILISVFLKLFIPKIKDFVALELAKLKINTKKYINSQIKNKFVKEFLFSCFASANEKFIKFGNSKKGKEKFEHVKSLFIKYFKIPLILKQPANDIIDAIIEGVFQEYKNNIEKKIN